MIVPTLRRGNAARDAVRPIRRRIRSFRDRSNHDRSSETGIYLSGLTGDETGLLALDTSKPIHSKLGDSP
jgi:hypothetical protein